MAEAGRTAAIVQRNLDHMNLAANDAALGTTIYGIVRAYNDLAAKYSALLAHIDTANIAGLGTGNAAVYGPETESLPTPDETAPLP